MIATPIIIMIIDVSTTLHYWVLAIAKVNVYSAKK